MECITLEVRPRIQSCSVFILTKKNSTESHEINLRLKRNSICLTIFNNLFEIDLESLIIIPESLSSLNISNDWITFRIQSSPIDSTVGTFSTEIIDTRKVDEKIRIDNNKFELPPKNIKLSLVCNCCKNSFTKSGIIFERILPLPSDDCDPCQWFCCSHAGDDIDIKTLLHPRNKDFFYGSHYFILNRNILLDKFKLSGTNDILCSRCLTVLGMTDIKNFGNSIKFWNYSLEFITESSPSICRNQTSPWIDFKAALLYCINDDIFNREIKLLAVEQNNNYSLIIKPMEKNLCLLTESRNSELNEIKLDKNFIIKVLYRYEKSQCSVHNNDSDLKICRISVQSIIAGINNLVSSSQRIPPTYRRIDPYYHVGYIL